MKESWYLNDRPDLVAKLRNIPLLGKFNDKYLKEMLALSRLRKYDAGETIIAEGAFEMALYLLIQGEVKVLKQGTELCRFTKCGEVFGEIGVVGNTYRTATVVAEKDCICLMINVSFLKDGDREEQLAFLSILYAVLAEIVAERLHKTSQELTFVKEELGVVREELSEVKARFHVSDDAPGEEGGGPQRVILRPGESDE